MQILTSFPGKIKNFFRQLPPPTTAFQITSSYLSGIHVAPQDRKIKSHFVLPLEDGLVESSFYKNNIKNPDQLRETIAEVAQIDTFAHNAAFLLPEVTQKFFVFTFDSLPSSREEREQIFRFRIKKQMPLIPDDCRITFDIIPDQMKTMALVSIARSSVIREFEDLFLKLRFKIRRVGIPSLSLLNLLDIHQKGNFAVIDVEEDAFSFLVVIDSALFLYRQKPFIIEPGRQNGQTTMALNIVQEVENTLNFIEDKEKKILESIWVRLGMLDPSESLFNHLEEKAPIALKRIETTVPFELEAKEKRILAPLIGQFL